MNPKPGKDGKYRFPRIFSKPETRIIVPDFNIPVDQVEEEYLRLLEAEQRDKMENKIRDYFPESGPYRRELYRKHMQFFAAGGQHIPMECCSEDCNGSPHRERCMLAANRIGKTESVGAYELVLHLTGDYPPWWTGKKFEYPISAWAAGDTGQTTRDIIQLKMLGPFGDFGTGMIPKHKLIHTTSKGGLAGAVETIYVRHKAGGRSELGLKSYDQGRISFQGTNKHVIWLDEECRREVYVECLLRTTNVGGILIFTFTPMQGMTDIVRDFLGMGEIIDGVEGKALEHAN